MEQRYQDVLAVISDGEKVSARRDPPVREPRSTIGAFYELRGPVVDWRRKGVDMIPTVILFGAFFGRWWRTTLAVAAFGWPALLVATDVAGVTVGLVEAGVLAMANDCVGVLIHQSLLYAYRRLRRITSSGVSH